MALLSKWKAETQENVQESRTVAIILAPPVVLPLTSSEGATGGRKLKWRAIGRGEDQFQAVTLADFG